MNEGTGDVKKIQPIHKDSVHKICSGQVVLSLAVAVKELIENSLDAEATNIDIRFKNYGIDLIEVTDNGSGVTEDNFAALTLKYHTSKLNDYSDLLGVASFGFRGEALSSLCALADLTITSRHRNSEYATKIQYDHKGNIVSRTPCSRQIGTTVSLTNLFSSLPVRQKELHKNIKREFNKMTQLLYAYCLISLNVKIKCSNQTSSNSKSLVVSTQGSSSYKDNIACVFGLKQLQSILEIKTEFVPNIKDNIFKGLSGLSENSEESAIVEDIDIDLSEDSNEADTKCSQSSSQKSQGHKNAVCPVELTGFISSCAHGSGRSSTDRQFYFVNSRPCEPTKVIKLVNEIYKQFNPNQYPFVFLNVTLERNLVDVNVTPDKRKVFLTKEKIILDVLKSSLLKLYENIPRTIKMEPASNFINIPTEKVKPELDQPRIFNSFLKQFSNNKAPDLKGEQRDLKSMELKRKSTTILNYVSSKSKKVNEARDNKEDEPCNIINEEILYENNEELDHKTTENSTDKKCLKESEYIEDVRIPEKEISHEDNKGEIMFLEYTDELPKTQIRSVADMVCVESHKTNCTPKKVPTKVKLANKDKFKEQKPATDQKELGKYKKASVSLKTSLDHVKMLYNIYNKNNNKSAPERVRFRSTINPVFNKKCEEELSREISKDSFKEMKIIGQFNLGFIITQLNDDLFIIDQHATDEIYNFETLQKTTELTSQKLVIPQPLELTGVNEQILMDNLDIFKKNGFTFEINEDALPTKRVKLLTLPMSKNWIFGKEDIEELLFMLRESQSEHCRPSRVRAMFASRACRKSVMIGTALGKADMRKLVDHMAEIDKPWNCPHGRPTIRHLVNLAMVQTSN